MNYPKIIGIGATGLVGKDTLFNILNELFPNKLERVALADFLKVETDEFCRKHYGFSSFTKDSAQKELIRPLFVVHGKIKRQQTQGKYWYSLLQERVDDIIKDGLIPVCTDIRYNYYSEDEYYWLKTLNSGVYIHVNRFNKDGSRVEALNNEEKAQEKILENLADYRLNWSTSDDKNYLIDTVSIQLKDLLDKIKENK